MLEREIAGFQEERRTAVAAEAARITDLEKVAQAIQEPVDRAWAEAAAPVRALAQELAQALLAAGVEPTDTVPHLPTPPVMKKKSEYDKDYLKTYCPGMRPAEVIRRRNELATARYNEHLRKAMAMQVRGWLVREQICSKGVGSRINYHRWTEYTFLTVDGRTVIPILSTDGYTLTDALAPPIVTTRHYTGRLYRRGESFLDTRLTDDYYEGGVLTSVDTPHKHRGTVADPRGAATQAVKQVRDAMLDFALVHGIAAGNHHA